MQDEPTAIAILDSAIKHLRENVLPTLDPRAQFEMRVTLNALSMVRRTLALTPQSDAAELERLKGLLNQDGDLATLNRVLAARVREGVMTRETPGLMAHLRATAVEKLAVDQPNYSAYKRATAQEN